MQITFLIFTLILSTQWRLGASIVTPSVTIKEENPPPNSPRITKTSTGVTQIIALVGQPLALECIPRDVMSNAKIIWIWSDPKDPAKVFHINTDMRSNDISRYKITKGTSAKNAIRLEVPTVSPSSAGMLTCRVNYMEGMAVQARRLIRVYANPRIVQYQSSFESVVVEGKNATLRCNATGIPKPQLYWRRIGGSSAVIRGYGRGYMGSTIVFSKTVPNDRGLYMCEAVNLMGSVLWPVKLNVMFKPQVKIYADNVVGQVRQRVGCRQQLLCIITGNPYPTRLRWTNNRGQSISATGTRVRTYTMQAADFTTYFSLNFNPVRSSDFGRYTCSADNSQGSGTKTVDFVASTMIMADRSGRKVCGASSLISSSLLLLLGLLAACGLR